RAARGRARRGLRRAVTRHGRHRRRADRRRGGVSRQGHGAAHRRRRRGGGARRRVEARPEPGRAGCERSVAGAAAGDRGRGVAVAAPPLNVVTGVFSYTGRAIARELLARGERVRSLSRRDAPGDPLRPSVEVAPLRFDDSLGDSLRGATALYNTYW